MASYISGYVTFYVILILICLRKWSLVHTQFIGPPNLSPSEALKLRSPPSGSESTNIPSVRGIASRQPSIVMLSQIPAATLTESRNPLPGDMNGNEGIVPNRRRRPSDFDGSLQNSQPPREWARQRRTNPIPTDIPTTVMPSVPTEAFNQQNFHRNPIENDPSANQQSRNIDKQLSRQQGTSPAEGPNSAANTLQELSAMIDRLQTLEARLLKMTADSQSMPSQRNDPQTIKPSHQNSVTTTSPTSIPYVPTTTASWQNIGPTVASNDQRSFGPPSFTRTETVQQVDPLRRTSNSLQMSVQETRGRVNAGSSSMFGPALSSGTNPPFDLKPPTETNPTFGKERSSGTNPTSDPTISSRTNPQFGQALSSVTNTQFGPALSGGTNPQFGTALSTGTSPTFSPALSSGTNPQFSPAFTSGTSSQFGSALSSGINPTFRPAIPSGANPQFGPAPTGTNPTFRPAIPSGTNQQFGTVLSSGTIPTIAPALSSGTNPTFGQSRFSGANPQFDIARSSGSTPIFGRTFPSGSSPTLRPRISANSGQTFASPNFLQPMSIPNNQRTFRQGAGVNPGGTFQSSNQFVISTPLPPSAPQTSNQGTISLQDLLLLSAMNGNNQMSSQTRESEFINAMMLMSAMPSSGQRSNSGTASSGSPAPSNGMSSLLYSVALGNAMTGASGNNMFDAERMAERMFRQ